MKRQIFHLLSLIVLVSALACRKPVSNPGGISLTLNDNIKIRMNETIDSVKRTLTLRCLTGKIYLCSNYWIESSSTVTNNKIAINFISVVPPVGCLESPWYASTYFNFDSLSNKNYELEFHVGIGYKVIGQLNVTSQSFTVTLPAQSKVQFENPVLQRIPHNTIYGTVHYSSLNVPVQKFIDSLQYYGAAPALYPAGDYFLFQIESNGQIKQTQDAGYYYTRYFIFNYSGNTAPLRDLVKWFGKAYPDAMVITLNTAKGETIYSWN